MDNKVSKYYISYDHTYYGVILSFFPCGENPEKDPRLEMIADFKYAMRDPEYMIHHTVSDLLDTIESLAQGDVGPELYERFCANIHFVFNTVYGKNLTEAVMARLKKVLYPNNELGEFEDESNLFGGNVSLFLKEPAEFQKYFKQTIAQKDLKVFNILFDDVASKAETKKYYNDLLANYDREIAYHSKALAEAKKSRKAAMAELTKEDPSLK